MALYRLLPADLGLALAQRTSARTRRRHDPTSAARLRAAARAYLQATDADAVVFGHSHAPDLAAGPGGLYANPGAWFEHRTFLRLDAAGWTLAKWTEQGVEVVKREA